MPGAFTAGYAADTGLDLAGIKMPVFAVASGRVVYAEAGHSLWSSPRDTDLAVLIELDEPLAFGDRSITHVWYAHLSELAFEQPSDATSRRRVHGGERLGTSGVANGAWHLHLGLLLDGVTTQRWGSFLLEDEIRQVLCGLRARQRLPTGARAPG
jgi:murein DD-endopeptidase MepM/ murein hydrolase activator NlpD